MDEFPIIKDPQWIKEREKVWLTFEEDFKEGLRKKELEELKQYFFTGVFNGARDFPDLTYFKWFPVQTPDGWDYVLNNLVERTSFFEYAFYYSLSDLTGSGLTDQQELELWDYFAGDIFQPVVKSRVPVGKEKKILTFEVDKGVIAGKVGGSILGWLTGSYGSSPKWIERINYFTTYLETLDDSRFELDEDGDIVTREGKIVRRLMAAIFNSILDEEISNEEVLIRNNFLESLKLFFDSITSPSNMKYLWEEIKEKYPT